MHSKRYCWLDNKACYTGLCSNRRPVSIRKLYQGKPGRAWLIPETLKVIHNLSAFKSIVLSEEKFAFVYMFSYKVTADQKNTSGSVVLFKKFNKGRNYYKGSYNFAVLNN